MNAPDKIWAEMDEGGNVFIASGVNKPDEHNMPFFTEYTRTDLLPPPAADYVAGLRDALYALNMVVLPKELPDDHLSSIMWETNRKYRDDLTIAQVKRAYAGILSEMNGRATKTLAEALAARPASPDTRVPTLVQRIAAALWFEAEGEAVERLYDTTDQRFVAEYEAKARAILGGGQDRG